MPVCSFTTLFSEVESDVYAKKGKRTKPVRGFGGNGGPGGPPGGDQRHRGPNLRGMGDLRDRDKKVRKCPPNCVLCVSGIQHTMTLTIGVTIVQLVCQEEAEAGRRGGLAPPCGTAASA
eukprot:scaffold206_cov400-Prasinococcus_capsulatus_cf.AAC.10